MTGPRFHTNYLLWAITAASLFIALGFVDPLAGACWKSDESLWHQVGVFARGDYTCSGSDLLLHILFLAGPLSVAAVLPGWLLQAVLVIVRERRQGTKGAGV